MQRAISLWPTDDSRVRSISCWCSRLDRRRRSRKAISRLFDRCARDQIHLVLSMVNLAEALLHACDYEAATGGLDLVAFLRRHDVMLHSPDVHVARRVAERAAMDDVSLADRLVLATAQVLGSRLYTTDPTLPVCRQRRLPVRISG